MLYVVAYKLIVRLAQYRMQQISHFYMLVTLGYGRVPQSFSNLGVCHRQCTNMYFNRRIIPHIKTCLNTKHKIIFSIQLSKSSIVLRPSM